jgi:hypothetical protein
MYLYNFALFKKLKICVLYKMSTMNFFRALFASPVGLTMEDDDILQETDLFVRDPSDVVTVLSFLQEGHRMTPWLPNQVQNPVQERVLAQRFLQQHDPLAMPMRLSLHEFMLQ